MKKTYLISLLILITAFSSKAQKNTGITTEEEYNYMIKGYDIQISSGLDMKKGYTIGSPVKVGNNNYTFEFLPLLKVAKDSVLVGYIVHANSLAWGNKYTFAIPYGDKDLLNRSFTAISALDDAMTTEFFKSYVGLETKTY
jgi:hypothetical protein